MDEYYGDLVSSENEFIRSASRGASITRFFEPKLLHPILDLICDYGNCLLVIDEADRVFPRKKDMSPVVDEILRRGRHYNIGIVWASQRPTMCHTDLLGVSAMVVVGRLVSIADAQYVRCNYGIDIQAIYQWTALLPDGRIGSLKLSRKEIAQNG